MVFQVRVVISFLNRRSRNFISSYTSDFTVRLYHNPNPNQRVKAGAATARRRRWPQHGPATICQTACPLSIGGKRPSAHQLPTNRRARSPLRPVEPYNMLISIPNERPVRFGEELPECRFGFGLSRGLPALRRGARDLPRILPMPWLPCHCSTNYTTFLRTMRIALPGRHHLLFPMFELSGAGLGL